MNLYITSH